MEERIVSCRIGGKEYPLCLTMRATKAVTEKFGGVAEVGEKMKNASVAEALDLVLWLLALLLREGCALRSLLHPEEPSRSAPGAEELELLLTPGDLLGLKELLLRTMAVGMGREVASEPGKNRSAGQTEAASLPG